MFFNNPNFCFIRFVLPSGELVHISPIILSQKLLFFQRYFDPTPSSARVAGFSPPDVTQPLDFGNFKKTGCKRKEVYPLLFALFSALEPVDEEPMVSLFKFLHDGMPVKLCFFFYGSRAFVSFF